MKLTKTKVLIVTLVILLAAGMYPYESVVVPAWRVKVEDLNGVACPNMPVMQMWGHYSLFLMGNHQSENAITDTNGVVEFPERRVRAIGFRRLIVPPITEILTLAHGSTGVSGAVSMSGLKDVAWLSYKGELPLPEHAKVEKCLTEDDFRPRDETEKQ